MFEILIAMLNTLLVVAMGIERVTEILKKFYIPIYNKIFKTEKVDMSIAEKQFLSLVIGLASCIALEIGIDIPNVNELPIVQQILAGTVASIGSNMIHSILGVVVAIKNNLSNIKK